MIQLTWVSILSFTWQLSVEWFWIQPIVKIESVECVQSTKTGKSFDFSSESLEKNIVFLYNV